MALIVVTGADGQLGRALRRVSSEEWMFCGQRELDVTSKGEVDRFFAVHRPAAVINCAAFTDVDRAETEREKAMAVNCDGARNLAEACRETGAMLVHISTDFVFDGQAQRPYTEEDTPAPVNFYGESKLAGERAVEASGCRGAIVRTSWLWSDDFGFVAAIRRKAAVEKEIRVVNDQVGSPTEAGSLAAALMKVTADFLPAENCALDSPPNAVVHRDSIVKSPSAFQLYHFCDGAIMSRAEWARTIIKDAELDCRVVDISTEELDRSHVTNNSPAAFRPTAARRPKFSALDATKFLQKYGC